MNEFSQKILILVKSWQIIFLQYLTLKVFNKPKYSLNVLDINIDVYYRFQYHLGFKRKKHFYLRMSPFNV